MNSAHEPSMNFERNQSKNTLQDQLQSLLHLVAGFSCTAELWCTIFCLRTASCLNHLSKKEKI